MFGLNMIYTMLPLYASVWIFWYNKCNCSTSSLQIRGNFSATNLTYIRMQYSYASFVLSIFVRKSLYMHTGTYTCSYTIWIHVLLYIKDVTYIAIQFIIITMQTSDLSIHISISYWCYTLQQCKLNLWVPWNPRIF